ncbi:hypothetical protein [Streptomyces sp. CCM_MD2014]|uniref:hypothetical protein n=1 Tax=Streptomyces sp. CCM_MD2014 TaxID=1561022 RepID=UPI00052AA572|nr:hypothetical protein [Streptomyces sp. CCM_MD2014]AIV35615.1 hypothetical protein NI25_20685 [Streptomyces sp. CCM_MD2014]
MATVGLCLADGSPIAVTVVRDCAGTVTSEGWIDLTTGAWSSGPPPAGTIACGDSRSITTNGTFCDVLEDGTVAGLVLVEYQYAADGSIASVRLVDAVTGTTYTPQGEVTTCPAGVEAPERDMLQLCDTTDDESGAITSVPFLRDYARDESGAVVGHTDYTLDGDPYTPSGTVGVCGPQTEPVEPCASTVTVLRLCDLNPDAPPDDEGKRCAIPFLRHLVHDCTGALAETRDTTTDGTTPYTPVEAVDCGSGGVPAMVEVPWEVVDIQPDPASPVGRGLIYTLSPIDDPATVGTVTVTTTATANTACPGTPPSYNFRNPCTYTFTPDQALQDAATYVRCDLIDFDTFEPVTGLNPPPSRLGGTAYWDGTTIRPTESNGTGEMYYDGPPASWSYRVGNTGGGNSCSSLSFAAVSLRPEGCCAPCGSSGGGDGSGRTVQEVCVIANSAPTEVMTWTRVIEDGGATIYYLDQDGARYDDTLPAGHQIIACAVEPEPCRNSTTLLLCDTQAEPEEPVPAEGEPTATDLVPPAPLPAGGAHVALPGGGADLWSGGTLVFPADPDATAGDGSQVYRSVAATLQADRPACDDGTATVTASVHVHLDGPTDAGGYPGAFHLVDGSGTDIALDAPPTDTVSGYDGVLVVSGTVPAADLAAGTVTLVLSLETFQSGGKAWTTDGFTADYVFGTGEECASPEPVQFLRTLVTDCVTGDIVSVTDTTLDGQPYTAAGEVSQCTATGSDAGECRHCETLTLCDVQPDEEESPGEGTEVPWTTVSVVEDPATAGQHTDFIFTISPQDDPSTVGTVHVNVSRAAGGACGDFDINDLIFSNTAQYHLTLDEVAQQVDFLRVDLLDFDGFEPVAILTGTPEPTRLGGTAVWNASHDRIIPTEDNSTGELYWDNPPATIAYEIFNTGGGTSCSRLSFAGVTIVPPPPPPPAGTRTPFLRTICRACDGSALSVTDTSVDGDPYTPAGQVTVCATGSGGGTEPGPDVEVLQLCDTPTEGADPVPFLRHLIYSDGAVPPFVLDTELDGVTPYVLAGEAVDCAASEPCRDSSSTLLCDTSAADLITVFDPANRPDDDGWEVVSFTGYHADAPPEAPLPYPARYGTPYGYPALGARADQYGGYGGGSWQGYDSAPVRWVLRKTFTAPEDGVAIAQSIGFRGDGGARVRINGIDAGMYGQWNQPATSGTAEIPVTAGANTVEIEVRDVNGVNNVVGRLDIALPKTVQFMRRQTVDCETGDVISTTDTTLDGEPYEVTGEVGQCTPTSECCEQPPPELRVDVESDVMCIRDADGEITGQVVVERVYDDQSGDRTEQRLTDPTTGDPVELPDGAELVLCQDPPCPTAFSTECVGAVTRTEAGYDNTSTINGVPGKCGSVQGPNGQFPCQPTTGALTITSWVVDGEEVIGEGGGRAFNGGPCGEGTTANPGMHHNWALALTNLDPSGANWSAQEADGCAWFVGSTGGTQTVYGPMTVVDAEGRQWILGPAQACEEVQFTKVYNQQCDGSVTVSWLDAQGVETDAPEGDLVPCGTGCGTGGGAGLDVETVALCDVAEDGTTVPFLRHITYGTGGQVSVVLDTGLDAFSAYTPSGTVGVCQPREDGQDVELLALCDVAEDGTSTPFLRHLVYMAAATAPAVLDTLLDGATPYTPAGEVGTCAPEEECPSRNMLSACRCDDTDGDGVADTGYVELLAVDCEGVLTSVGTYTEDLSAPYTPVAPVDCETADPGPEPVVSVQAHRVQLAPGQSWDASTVASLRSVTLTAHTGDGLITTGDGVSTLFQGESVSWSINKETDAALVGPLTVDAVDGVITVTWTRTS